MHGRHRRQPRPVGRHHRHRRGHHPGAAVKGPENDLLTQLIDPETGLATMLGWEVVHFRPAKTKRGWRTPVQGSLGVGWPDLILARPPRLIAAELKSDVGKVTEDQRRVLAVLGACGLEVHVWHPRDLDAIAVILR